MTNAAQSVVWKAVYKPFGEVQSITGSATLNARFPGQWFQLEAGLHYNWWRHYDPTTGRYTQVDPLGMNQGPAAPAPVSASHMAGAQVLSASLGATADLILGVGPSVPDQGPADLSAGFGTLGNVTPLGLAGDFAAGAAGRRLIRDGTSLYGYVRQSPFAYTDPDGRFIPIIAGAAVGIALEYAADYLDSNCSCGGGSSATGISAGAAAGASLGDAATTVPYPRAGVGGASGSGATSRLSSGLSKLFGSSGISLPAPTLANPLARTANLGRAAGRWAPIMGAAYAGWDIYRIVKCLTK